MKKKMLGWFIVALLILPVHGRAAEGPIETLKGKNADKLGTQCQVELATYCSHVTPGNQRGLACLYAHGDKLSGPCEAAFYEVAEELKNATDNLSAFASACREDMEKLCSKVVVGEGRVLKCLEENKAKVSAKCNEVRGQAEGDLGKKKDVDYQYHAAKIQ